MLLPAISNVPEYQEQRIYRGSDLIIPFDVTNADGTIRDITDDIVLAQGRRLRLGSAAAFEFTIVKNDPTHGRFYAQLLGAVTALIPCGEQPFHGASQYWYDVKITGVGLNKTLRYGPAIIYASVSR